VFEDLRAACGSGALLVACRLAGLSALGAHYADIGPRAQFRPTQPSRRPFAAFGLQGGRRVCLRRLRPGPEALARNAGPPGGAADQSTAAQRVSQQGADTPAPAACA
jgi:hypothetical protein